MRTFQALSYADKWRVTWLLGRGEAPGTPRMATAAIELGESYRRQGRIHTALVRWLPAAMIIVFGFIALPAAVAGDALMAIAYVAIVVGSVGHLIFNPAIRPSKVAKALEASKRVIASTGG